MPVQVFLLSDYKATNDIENQYLTESEMDAPSRNIKSVICMHIPFRTNSDRITTVDNMFVFCCKI